MFTPKFKAIACLSFFVLVLLTPLVHAQSAWTSVCFSEAELAKLNPQVADAKGSADIAWMLTSSALVLMMTSQGLAMFYGGLVRKKNVLSTMMQSFAMMAIITVLWALCGYSLRFGDGGSFIGHLHNAFLRGVGAQPDADHAATIPRQTFMGVMTANITW